MADVTLADILQNMQNAAPADAPTAPTPRAYFSPETLSGMNGIGSILFPMSRLGFQLRYQAAQDEARRHMPLDQQ
jgi:hypothetical protein